jgi:copper chaperone
MTEFQVEGMTCQHCVAAVTRSIRDIDNQAQVSVDLERGRVVVESSLPVDALKEAIDGAGYAVLSAKNA